MTLFEWLRSILHHAARIGRFWYTLKDDRRAVKLVFEDTSVALVTSAQARVKRAAKTDTLARKFLMSYQISPRDPEEGLSVVFPDELHEVEETEEADQYVANLTERYGEPPSSFD